MGRGRAGLHIYEWLENLVGGYIHSADRILPECQDVGVGDEFRLHPEVPLEVAPVEPGRWLVVRGGVPMGNSSLRYDFTSAFTLRERPDGTTRLLFRDRYAHTRWWAPILLQPVEAVSFVMSQKMLRGFETGPNGQRFPSQQMRHQVGRTHDAHGPDRLPAWLAHNLPAIHAPLIVWQRSSTRGTYGRREPDAGPDPLPWPSVVTPPVAQAATSRPRGGERWRRPQ